MSCVVAGLRYYFRIYKYEYLGELMTSELHIALYLIKMNKITRISVRDIRRIDLIKIAITQSVSNFFSELSFDFMWRCLI